MGGEGFCVYFRGELISERAAKWYDFHIVARRRARINKHALGLRVNVALG